MTCARGPRRSIEATGAAADAPTRERHRATRLRAAHARRESVQRDVVHANRPGRTATMHSSTVCRMRPRFARCAQA
ncbi:hypothetical protein CFB82_25160 [Burkholderia sp. HI2714]|nr:hypothetical protein CFB82_25160 [Burkholderia sp. HI2714]